jgi:hypothetical protein
MYSAANLSYKNIILFLLLSLGCQILYAQSGYRSTVTSSVNRSVFALGEQIDLTVTYSYPVAELPKSVPYVNDTFPHFEVISRKKADTVVNGDFVTIRQVNTITSFDTGHWTIPRFVMETGKTSITSDTIGIDVVPVPMTSNTYHDIKEIIEVAPEPFDWKKWLGILVTVLVVAAGLWYYLKHRKKPKPELPRFDTKLSPLDQALLDIGKLRQSGLMEKGETKTYYSRLYDIARVFFERQVRPGFMQYTTDETLIALKDKSLDAEGVSSLAEALRVADAVKFAKYKSSVQESKTMADKIETIIRRIPQKV